MTASTLSVADILTMPLSELRERVDLAERLAIASRHTPAGTSTSAAAATPVKPAAAAAAPKPTPAATPAPAAVATTPPATAAVSDDEMALGGGSPAASDLGDFSASDDMLADFVEQLSPEDAKAKAVAIAKQVISKKDNSELAIAREIMQKYGVSKVSEVAAGKEVELYNDFRAKFPQYPG